MMHFERFKNTNELNDILAQKAALLAGDQATDLTIEESSTLLHHKLMDELLLSKSQVFRPGHL